MHSRRTAGIRVAAVGFAVCLITVAGLACSAEGVRTPPTATPEDTATPATVPAMPRPTSTPIPAPERPPPTGRVLSRLLVSCEAADFGFEVRVRYGAAIQDTDSPVAILTRVQLRVNGAPYEDTGRISDKVFAREITFYGKPERLYRIQMNVDTWGAPEPSDFVQVVRCPEAPGNPLAVGVSY